MAGTVWSRTARCGSFPLALLLATACPSNGYDVVEITEHWALTVGGPDVPRSAPQVSMVMSATGDTESDYFLVTLNHWSSPSFLPGGVQAQHWRNDEVVNATHSQAHSPLDVDGETIRWAQRISLNDCVLQFDVINGSSASWGDFTNGDSLSLSTHTTLARLNSYLPAVSLNESGIGYAGNRVSSLVLERITWRDSEGEEYEMIAPIDIDSDLDP